MLSISRRTLIPALATALLFGPALASDEPDERMPGRTAMVNTGVIAKFVAKPPTGTLFDLPDLGVGGNEPTAGADRSASSIPARARPTPTRFPSAAGGRSAVPRD